MGQGKQRICNGLGLTNQGASLCASDHYLCPSSNVPTTHTSPDLFAGSDSCKDKKGKYRDKKCAKKLQKGKCSKKKIAKNLLVPRGATIRNKEYRKQKPPERACVSRIA